jgi:ricin-type beta-trefoil lectin protein
MNDRNNTLARALASLSALTLFIGASGCAMDAQSGDGGEGSEVVASDTAAVVHAGIAQAFRNFATMKCLDGNAAGSVYTSGCYWASYQSWVPTLVGEGYQIRNTQTGRCLDSNVDGKVYTQPCNRGRYQQWYFDAHSPTRLRNVSTLKYLDSNGAGSVYTLAGNGGNYQRWEQSCLNGVLCLEL